MDIDTLDTVEHAKEKISDAKDDKGANKRRLNACVAISVALLATFMAICKVKDDNIVQAMQQAQADKIDFWSFYQARNIRQEVMASTVIQLEAQRIGAPAAQVEKLDQLIAQEKTAAAEQDRKKAELKKQAEDADKRYNDLNFHDDQFDLSDALLAIAVAMLAVTALTELWWMFFLAMVPSTFGVLMGMAGLFESTTIHPDTLIKLLS
ncbi:DUF4337 domain-containing protein [Burkholderiaceae bacterium UC74_6]